MDTTAAIGVDNENAPESGLGAGASTAETFSTIEKAKMIAIAAKVKNLRFIDASIY